MRKEEDPNLKTYTGPYIYLAETYCAKCQALWQEWTRTSSKEKIRRKKVNVCQRGTDTMPSTSPILLNLLGWHYEMARCYFIDEEAEAESWCSGWTSHGLSKARLELKPRSTRLRVLCALCAKMPSGHTETASFHHELISGSIKWLSVHKNRLGSLLNSQRFLGFVWGRPGLLACLPSFLPSVSLGLNLEPLTC
jgi:hypothetical protein